MKRVLKSIVSSISQLIADESGELLSTRRKALALQSQVNSLSRQARKQKRGTAR